MHLFDYLIVGAGLYGATFAYQARKKGKRCLVIDKRPHLGGNLYCENIAGIHVHKYGPHIFHTSNKAVWDFVNSIVPFNRYTNTPIANFRGEIYNLLFNMNTFHQLWGVISPQEAQRILEEQRLNAKMAMEAAGTHEPRNLEEQSDLMEFDSKLRQVSEEIYQSVTTTKEARKFGTYYYVRDFRTNGKRGSKYYFYDLCMQLGYLLNRIRKK